VSASLTKTAWRPACQAGHRKFAGAAPPSRVMSVSWPLPASWVKREAEPAATGAASASPPSGWNQKRRAWVSGGGQEELQAIYAKIARS